MLHARPVSAQPADRIAVVDAVWAGEGVRPGDRLRQTQCLVDCRGYVLGLLWIGGRVTAYLVRRADHRAALHSPTGKEHLLDRAPVVAPGQLGRRTLIDEHTWSPAELSRHHDQHVIEQP